MPEDKNKIYFYIALSVPSHRKGWQGIVQGTIEALNTIQGGAGPYTTALFVPIDEENLQPVWVHTDNLFETRKEAIQHITDLTILEVEVKTKEIQRVLGRLHYICETDTSLKRAVTTHDRTTSND